MIFDLPSPCPESMQTHLFDSSLSPKNFQKWLCDRFMFIPLYGCPDSAQSSGSSEAPPAKLGTSYTAPPHNQCWPQAVPVSKEPPGKIKPRED